jgi:hypothetical protein
LNICTVPNEWMAMLAGVSAHFLPFRFVKSPYKWTGMKVMLPTAFNEQLHDAFWASTLLADMLSCVHRQALWYVLCRVFCQELRTQRGNKERALQILRNKLFEIQLQQQREEISSARKSQIGTGSRSEKIKTYNYKDARVSDHRLKNNYPLESMLQGTALEQNVQVSAQFHPVELLVSSFTKVCTSISTRPFTNPNG